MRIRALANGNVIEAHDDAAKELIEAGIYEKVSDAEPLSSEVSNAQQVPAQSTAPKKRSPRAHHR